MPSASMYSRIHKTMVTFVTLHFISSLLTSRGVATFTLENLKKVLGDAHEAMVQICTRSIPPEGSQMIPPVGKVPRCTATDTAQQQELAPALPHCSLHLWEHASVATVSL